MANVINGNDIGIYVGGVLIGCLTGADWTSARNSIDVTCKDNSGDKAVILGGADTSISFNGLFKPDSTYGLEDLIDLYIAKTEVSVAYGDLAQLGIYQQMFLQTLSISGPLNAAATFSGTFMGTGSFVKYES